MLARANRVTRAGDFRSIVRQGRRHGGEHVVVHVLAASGSEPTRFGFVVGKSVGTAVTRNQVRRRLRASCRELLRQRPTGSLVVVRALPASARAGWTTLQDEVVTAMDKGVTGP